MTDLLNLMAAPFAACAVLVGIHAYLGMHVIQRRVIFVDLALAQLAALGATFSFLLGMSPHGEGAYFFALGFAIVGAAVFALTRMRHERVPQEAIIGVVYAVALAFAILVADRAPEGAEHIKETLVGAVLWVTWPTVIKTAAIYALVGALHVALRKRFIQLSFHPEQAYAEKRWVRLWDFIFYITFAFVITSSVAIAGVLLVFTFLVIPAVIATLFARTIPARLAIGWTVGIAACLVGLLASYRFDLPSGPSVVSSLGVFLILAGLVHYVRSAERTGNAVLKTLAVAGAVAGAIAVLGVFFANGGLLQIPHEHAWEPAVTQTGGRPDVSPDSWEQLKVDCEEDRTCIAATLGARPDWPTLLSEALDTGEPEAQETALHVLARLDDPRRFDVLARVVGPTFDRLLRLRAARILVDGDDRRGLEIALTLLEEDSPPFVRDGARRLLVERSGLEADYDPLAGPEHNAAAIEQWAEWLKSGSGDRAPG